MGSGRCWPPLLPREPSSRSPGPPDLGPEQHFSGSHSTCTRIGPRSPHLQLGVSSVHGREGGKGLPDSTATLHAPSWCFWTLAWRGGCARVLSHPGGGTQVGPGFSGDRGLDGQSTSHPQSPGSLSPPGNRLGSGVGQRQNQETLPSPLHPIPLSLLFSFDLGFLAQIGFLSGLNSHSPPSM